MRILIDATPLLVRGAGIKSYFDGWIRAILSHHQAGVEVGLYPFLRTLPALDHRRSPDTSRSAWWRVLLSNLVSAHVPGAMEHVCRGFDVFHASHHLLRMPRSAPSTATVFDMTCWLLPQMHTRGNVAATKEYAERTLRRADRLVAISECTRLDCARLLAIPEERIDVIYPGVREEFFSVSSQQSASVRDRLGLQRPYVLYVGCIEPRKNLGRLLDAWAEFHNRHPRDFELAVAGTPGWETNGILHRLGSSAGVRWMDYVPEPDLPGLVRGASALVYPSLYEGFGLPAAQAMAAGVPVITSNCSCLPEITGGAARLVDPLSQDSITSALEEVLTSPGFQKRLAIAGRKKAEDYRMTEVAARSLEFFRRFAGA